MKFDRLIKIFSLGGGAVLVLAALGCQAATKNQRAVINQPAVVADSPSIDKPPVVLSYESTKPVIKHSLKILPVPFMVQAPYGNWGLPYQEACEEASMIMATEYFKGNKSLRLSAADADKAILQLVEWQKQERGFYEDTTANEVASILQDYFKLTARVMSYDAGLIRQAIDSGNLVLVPAAGRKLGNPYFRRPGPLYHMLLIKGYQGDELITNDPGTRRGENYRYAEKIVAQAAHDWNGGQVETGAAVMIIVSPSQAE